MKFKRLVEEVSDIDYSVIHYSIANAERFHDEAVDTYEDNVKKLKLQIPNEDKDAHQDIKSPELKKLMLSESLFETYEDTQLVEEVVSNLTSNKLLDAVDEGILDARQVLLACIKYMSEDDVVNMMKANEFLSDSDEILDEDIDGFTYKGVSGKRYNRRNLSELSNDIVVTIPETKLTYEVRAGTQFEDDAFLSSLAKLVLKTEDAERLQASIWNMLLASVPEYSLESGMSKLINIPAEVNVLSKSTKITEAIEGNSSHADEFINALRSAGFGDGFDQKLKIDQYQTGTRVEYKDQGGHFIVTITDDKVVLEGQDEGSEEFKKEFTTWQDFANEFEELYPGIPVHECNKMLNEAKVPEMIDNYNRVDGARYLVYKTREPLAYVIEAELTSGEICYLDKNGHVTQSVMPHKDYPVGQVSVQWDEWDMPFVKVWGPSKEYFDEAIKVAEKYGKDYEIHTEKYVKGPRKFWLEIIVDEEDTEEPYVDPDAPVYSSKKADVKDDESEDELTGRHMKDNEDLEDSQRYPIESPAPAQTGLLNEEKKLEEDVMMNGALNEVRISTEGIRNFKPWDGAVDTFNNILEAGKMEEFERQLEETHPEGIGSTELNDMLWFDKEHIYYTLGMTEYQDTQSSEE